MYPPPPPPPDDLPAHHQTVDPVVAQQYQRAREQQGVRPPGAREQYAPGSSPGVPGADPGSTEHTETEPVPDPKPQWTTQKTTPRKKRDQDNQGKNLKKSDVVKKPQKFRAGPKRQSGPLTPREGRKR